MGIRVFVFDDDPFVRRMLARVFKERKCRYEIRTFSKATLCDGCPCSFNETCVDVIVSDNQMPGCKGLDFICHQMAQDCKCLHIALVSGDWTPSDVDRAKEIPCQVFSKPLDLNAMSAWLDTVEEEFDPSRVLKDFFPGARVDLDLN